MSETPLSIQYPRVKLGLLLGFILWTGVIYYLSPTPRTFEDFLARARSQALLGELEEAEAMIDHAIALKPDDGVVYYVKGEILQTMGDQQATTLAFKKAVQYAPASWVNLSAYANSLFYEKRYEEALVQYEKLREMMPGDPGVLLQTGRSYLEMGEPGKALEFFSKAIQIDPKRGEVYLWMGMAHVVLGRADEAVKAFETAKALTPNDPRIREGLSKLEALRNKKDEEPFSSPKEDGK